MSDRLVIDFYNTEDDDWIRSPQVTKRHRSDAELFGKKMIRVIKKEGMNKAEFVESEHPRGQPKNAGEFSEKPGGGGEDVTEPKRQIAEQKEPNKPLSMADRNRIEMPALEDRGKRKVARVENSVYSDASQELLTAVLDELTLHISRAQEYNEKSSIYNAKSKILDIWSAASLTREGYYKFADAIIEQTSGLEQSPVYKQAVEWSVDAADKKYLKSIDFLQHTPEDNIMDFQREQGGTLQATLDLVINAQNIEPENLNDSDSIQAVGVANVDLLMNIRDAAKRIRGHDISNSSTLKDSIVSDIADESGIGYLTSNSLIGSWASSSNDTNPVSLGAQIAVADTLGSPLSDWQKRQIDGLASHRDEMDTTAKSVAPPAIKAIYNITQQAFRAVGLSPDDTVVLYRGMDGVVGIDPGEVVAYHGNASESWSFDKDTADGFGHRTFATRVRVKDIYSTCYTGVGCLGEAEVVTINNSNRESVMIDRSRFR